MGKSHARNPTQNLTGGVGDSFVLLPRILGCWGSFARAFLPGRLVNNSEPHPKPTRTDPDLTNQKSEEKKKEAKKGCFSHDISVILIFIFLTRAAASFLSLSWAFGLVLYRRQIQMALRLPEDLPGHLPAA